MAWPVGSPWPGADRPRFKSQLSPQTAWWHSPSSPALCHPAASDLPHLALGLAAPLASVALFLPVPLPAPRTTLPLCLEVSWSGCPPSPSLFTQFLLIAPTGAASEHFQPAGSQAGTLPWALAGSSATWHHVPRTLAVSTPECISL